MDTPDDALGDWDALGFIVSSQYRGAVVAQLSERAATPTQITDEYTASISHISRAIRELRDEGCVELLVAEETKVGRLYGLSDRGESLLDFAAGKGVEIPEPERR